MKYFFRLADEHGIELYFQSYRHLPENLGSWYFPVAQLCVENFVDSGKGVTPRLVVFLLRGIVRLRRQTYSVGGT